MSLGFHVVTHSQSLPRRWVQTFDTINVAICNCRIRQAGRRGDVRGDPLRHCQGMGWAREEEGFGRFRAANRDIGRHWGV